MQQKDPIAELHYLISSLKLDHKISSEFLSPDGNILVSKKDLEIKYYSDDEDEEEDERESSEDDVEEERMVTVFESEFEDNTVYYNEFDSDQQSESSVEQEQEFSHNVFQSVDEIEQEAYYQSQLLPFLGQQNPQQSYDSFFSQPDTQQKKLNNEEIVIEQRQIRKVAGFAKAFGIKYSPSEILIVDSKTVDDFMIVCR